MIARFLATYRLYRRNHRMMYALRRAYDIEVKGLPF